jgi:hypothetical protein
MTATATTDTRDAAQTVGEPRELAWYTAATGTERVLGGQRVAGVRLTDCPESGGGRAYLIERELEQDGYTALKALVDDHVTYAGARDRIPMATGAAPKASEPKRRVRLAIARSSRSNGARMVAKRQTRLAADAGCRFEPVSASRTRVDRQQSLFV